MEETGSQELLQNLLTPDSRTRLLHRDSTCVQRNNTTEQQHAEENERKHAQHSCHEAQERTSTNNVTMHSTYENNELSTPTTTPTIASQELLQNLLTPGIICPIL
ncbi:hypothetical protein KSP39_PZI014118 [Platanthera zijinensis]|uniref:Uncharacterized protein n=1 Tax=Platanthera zijinensis TaxID=2320716 RepID=A0AAP0G3Z3_9ASPA